MIIYILGMLYYQRQQNQNQFCKSKVLLTSHFSYWLTQQEASYVNNSIIDCNLDYQLIPLSDIGLESIDIIQQLKTGQKTTKRKTSRSPNLSKKRKPIHRDNLSQITQSIEPIQSDLPIELNSPTKLAQPKKPIESSQIPPPMKSSQEDNQKKFEAFLKKGMKIQENLFKKNKPKKPKSKMSLAKREEREAVIKMGHDYIQKVSENAGESGTLLRKSEMAKLYRVFSILIDMKSDIRNRTNEKRKKLSERREELFLRIKQLTLDQVREIAKILHPMNNDDKVYINVTQITKKNVTLIEKTIKAYEEENKKLPNLLTFEQLTKQKEPVKYDPIDILNDSLSSSLSDSSDTSSIDSAKSKKINELKEIMKDVPDDKKKD